MPRPGSSFPSAVSRSKRRRGLACILVMLACSLGLAATGDINADGRVDVADHVLLSQYLRGDRTLTPPEASAADFDGDGTVGAADLTALRDWMLERYAPAVVSVSPAPYSHVATLAEIQLEFNKRYHVGPASETGFHLVEAGPDGYLGTEDDVPVAGAADLHPPSLDFLLATPASATSGTGPGVYGLSVGAPIADFQGRPMVPYSTKFLVTGGPADRDSDFDGVTDEVEIADGTHPLLADTDGDWADDGLEKQSGTDPKNPFSVPGEAGNGRFVGSLMVSYSNLTVETGKNVPADATFVFSAMVSYSNMPVEAGNTVPVGATFVTSGLVSYANLAVEAGNTVPEESTYVSSALVSYSNMPVEVGNAVPTDAIHVTSALVSYANTSVETGNAVPASAAFVVSPSVSYANQPVESPAPTLPPRVIVSDLVSYQNNG